jgi:hypothetical protein
MRETKEDRKSRKTVQPDDISDSATCVPIPLSLDKQRIERHDIDSSLISTSAGGMVIFATNPSLLEEARLWGKQGF